MSENLLRWNATRTRYRCADGIPLVTNVQTKLLKKPALPRTPENQFQAPVCVPLNGVALVLSKMSSRYGLGVMVSGALYSRERRRLLRGNASARTLAIGKPTKRVSSGACALSDLRSVFFTRSVRKLGETAFAWCTELRSVHFAPGLEEIDESAFEGC